MSRTWCANGHEACGRLGAIAVGESSTAALNDKEQCRRPWRRYRHGRQVAGARARYRVRANRKAGRGWAYDAHMGGDTDESRVSEATGRPVREDTTGATSAAQS